MKKRIALWLRLIALLLPTLTSCLTVDTLREQRADWTDETRTDILFHDETYRPLPMLPDKVTIHMGRAPSGYVADQDVPLLLIDNAGDRFNYSDDGRFLRVYNYYHQNEWDSGMVYYCRADLYDDMVKQIESLSFDRYASELYRTYIVSESVADDLQRLILTAEESAAVKAILAAEQNGGDITAFNENRHDCQMINLQPSTEDGLFLKSDKNITFYYNAETHTYFLEDAKTHLVPASHIPTFDSLADRIIKADGDISTEQAIAVEES